MKHSMKVTFNTKQHMVDKGIETFIDEIKQIIDDSRSKAVRSVDFCRVQMYWAIGKRISEKEQQGMGVKTKCV